MANGPPVPRMASDIVLAYAAKPSESARGAAQRMSTRNVGMLVVVDARSHPVGVLTDRDIVISAVANALDIGQARVADLASSDVYSVSESVEIRGEIPRIQTEDSSLGTVVEQKRIEDLPLNGRHVFNLVKVVAGAGTGCAVSAGGAGGVVFAVSVIWEVACGGRIALPMLLKVWS